jgi:hypothetical protein
MSVFGVTNYLLVTQKGRTYIPFVRGSGFFVDFVQHGFHTRHVLTCGHIATPLRYPQMFGRPPLFSRIGERHLTPKALLFDPHGTRRAMLPVEYNINTLKGTCVASMRIKNERDLFLQMERDGLGVPRSFELDLENPTVGENEEVVFHGLKLDRDEEAADVAEMTPMIVPGKAKLNFLSELLGSTVIVSTGTKQVSAGMSGCPVIRRSNGKCVGMLICAVKTKNSDPSKIQTPFSAARNLNANSTEDPLAAEEDKERRKKASIFNEERLPRRVSDDTAMQLAMKEFEEAHRQMEPPRLDLVGQDGTLEELGVKNPTAYANDQEDEQFAAFVPVKDFVGALRYSEKV